jgi:predicted nucleotidyltransferase
MTNDQALFSLATILDKWIAAAPDIPAIYLFGSRVRGDHRPDSDVDVRIFLDEWCVGSETLRWWQAQNETDFKDLKARLPGPLAIHREKQDAADQHIRAASKSPVMIVGRIVCVWTPPMPRPTIVPTDR